MGLIWLFMGFNGDYRGLIHKKTKMLVDILSGKPLHNELENHPAIHGKIHYFYGNFQ